MTLDDRDALVERLVRAGRADGPSVRARRAAPLAVSTLLASTVAQAAAAGAAPAALSPLLLVKWVGVGTLAGASLMVLVHAPDFLRPSAPARARAAASAPAAARKVRTMRVEASATPPPASPSPSVSSPRVAPRPDVAREVLLLDRARRELLEGDPAAALRSLALLEQLPRRALAPEATLLRVRALLDQGKHEEARGVAEAFRAAAPSSPQAEVLRALVADTEIQPTPARL